MLRFRIRNCFFFKSGPTVADDIKTGGTYAVLASLLGIFIYILFRFNKWQFSLGAVAALAHDVIIILGFFSFFKNIMPFNMEINKTLSLRFLQCSVIR